MLFLNNKYRVLELLFDQPTKELNVRHISRLAKVSTTTVTNALKELQKRNIIKKRRAGNALFVSADRESNHFIRLKRLYNIQKIYDSGIVDYLVKEYEEPDAIVLFGSFSRGDDTEKSDIDITVVGSRKTANVERFERILGRKISIHELSLRQIEKEFFLNLANGFVLYGALYEGI